MEHEQEYVCPMCGGPAQDDLLANIPEADRERWMVALGLARTRRQFGLSQADLGALIGHSRDFVVKIELAQRSLSADKALLIARKLNIEVGELLGVSMTWPTAVSKAAL